jgi:7,8-dihydroneopterin aldolase/epimerase/oxygenase
MLTIELTNLRFFAHHGLYKEEVLTGNEFLVNLAVSFITAAEVITAIDETINYVSLFEIVKKSMSVPTPLLETIAMQISGKIYKTFPQVKKTTITITKLQAPIENFIGQTGIKFEQEY